MMGRNESAEKRYAGMGNVADTAMAYVVPSGSGSLYRNTQIGLFIEAHQDIDVILGYGKSTACGMLMGSPMLDRRSQPISTIVLNQRFNSN